MKTLVRRITQFSLLSVCFALWTAIVSHGATGIAVWPVDSLTRVMQTDPPQSNVPVTLYAAGGEYADFQIAIQAPSGGLTNTNVVASDLTGPGGAIASTNVLLYRELYVDVTQSSPNWGGSNQPLPRGYYPDPLLPFVDPDTGLPPNSGATYQAVPFSVSGGQNQPIWVDVFVPRGTAAGEYQGVFTITSDQGSAQVQLVLNVWNFSVPLKPSLLSSFNAGGTETRAVDLALLRHRLMPDQVVSASTEASDVANYGLTSVDLGIYSGANYGQCHMSAAPSAAAFAAAKASNNSNLLIYDYSADEIDNCTNVFPTLIQWAANMHAAGVNNLVTMAPTPALFSDGTGSGRSAVDIWATETDEFATSSTYVAQALAKGDQVWSYTDLVQDAYTPKWEIDFLPINFRIIPGWINPVLGLTGILYWNVVDWSSDPYTDVYAPDNPGYPGEGQLVYPGAPAGLQGLAPSMRLKWLRDGVQDYEYFQILKALGQSAFALQVAQSVGPDWTNWTRNPATLEAAKIKLGQAINSSSGSTGGSGTSDFSISATPSSQTVFAGSNTSYSLNVGALDGFTGIVGLAASGLPAGVGASFTPASVTGGSGTSILSVTTASTATAGIFTITIQGTSNGLTHETTVQLVIDASTPPPPPDFSISTSPSSQTVSRGGSTAYSITITPIHGFTGTVSFGVSGLPSQTRSSFSPSSVTGSGSSTLKITAGSKAPRSTYTLTIKGKSGTLSHHTTVSLTVH